MRKRLRLAGVEPANIAPIMGHADSRMVERVYGKVTPMDLASKLSARLNGAALIAPDPSPFAVLYLYGSEGETGTRRRRGHSPDLAFSAGKPVPRDGIEPPTRGFSIPCSTN